MDHHENFSETPLSDKEDLYSHLNVEEIAYADFVQAKRVRKDHEIKKLGNIMICMFKAIHYC